MKFQRKESEIEKLSFRQSLNDRNDRKLKKKTKHNLNNSFPIGIAKSSKDGDSNQHVNYFMVCNITINQRHSRVLSANFNHRFSVDIELKTPSKLMKVAYIGID